MRLSIRLFKRIPPLVWARLCLFTTYDRHNSMFSNGCQLNVHVLYAFNTHENFGLLLGASPAFGGGRACKRVALALQSWPSAYADGQDRLRRPPHPLRVGLAMLVWPTGGTGGRHTPCGRATPALFAVDGLAMCVSAQGMHRVRACVSSIGHVRSKCPIPKR